MARPGQEQKNWANRPACVQPRRSRRFKNCSSGRTRAALVWPRRGRTLSASLQTRAICASSKGAPLAFRISRMLVPLRHTIISNRLQAGTSLRGEDGEGVVNFGQSVLLRPAAPAPAVFHNDPQVVVSEERAKVPDHVRVTALLQHVDFVANFAELALLRTQAASMRAT